MAEISAFPEGLFEACCYLIKLPTSTCLIDPAVGIHSLPANLPPIRWLIATHGHIDHISQADSLRQATGAPLWIHADDGRCMTDSRQNLSAMLQQPAVFAPAEHFLADGQIMELTDGYSLKTIHTPGHTAGCVCLLLRHIDQPEALFSGDTLFAGSIGRLDLGGDPTAMKRSLARLRELAHYTSGQVIRLYPGHGPASELHHEIKTNPYL